MGVMSCHVSAAVAASLKTAGGVITLSDSQVKPNLNLTWPRASSWSLHSGAAPRLSST
jgi:hypothetical protein